MLSYHRTLQSLYPRNQLHNLLPEDQKQLNEAYTRYTARLNQKLLAELIDYKVNNQSKSVLINELIKKLNLISTQQPQALSPQKEQRLKENISNM